MKETIFTLLAASLGAGNVAVEISCGDVVVDLQLENLLEACRLLKDSTATSFDMCMDVTAIDNSGRRKAMEKNYNLNDVLAGNIAPRRHQKKNRFTGSLPIMVNRT